MRIIWYSGEAGVIRSSRSTSRARDRGDRFGQLRVGDALAQLLDLGLLAFAELVLDRLQLLAQVVLPLRVGHLLLRGRLDLALHLEQRDLAVERVRHRLAASR